MLYLGGVSSMRLFCSSSLKLLPITFISHGCLVINKQIMLLATQRVGVCLFYFYLNAELNPSLVVVWLPRSSADLIPQYTGIYPSCPGDSEQGWM